MSAERSLEEQVCAEVLDEFAESLVGAGIGHVAVFVGRSVDGHAGIVSHEFLAVHLVHALELDVGHLGIDDAVGEGLAGFRGGAAPEGCAGLGLESEV